MRVQDIRIVTPAAARVRLEASVVYPDRWRGREQVGFEVDEAAGDALDAASGNAFLAALLPLATQLEQPLRIEAPVDEPLLRGAREIRAIWARWYGTRTDLPLEAPVARAPERRPAVRAAFFSGGIDSTFSAWRAAGRLDTPPSPGTLERLLFVEGFDLPLGAPAALAVARANALAGADELGLPLTAVATNLRETRWREVDWRLLGHGAALAACALALGGWLAEARVAASVFSPEDTPWGSHPETTARFSSATLRLVEDGAEVERMSKLRALARHPAAVRHLRVCWQSPAGDSCGTCRKCLVARVMLDLLAGPSVCPGLPRAPDMLARLGALEPTGADEWRDLRAIQAQALANGRRDVVDALARTLAGERAVRNLTTLARPRSMRLSWWRRLAARAGLGR